MPNITSGKQVHALNKTINGAYPYCNPGLLVGSVRGDGGVYYFGRWQVCADELSCAKCIKIAERLEN